MRMLYDKKLEVTHVFNYRINTGGINNVTEGGDVRIVFVDGKFSHVDSRCFSQSVSINSRNLFRIYSEINEEITKIEESFEDKNENKKKS